MSAKRGKCNTNAKPSVHNSKPIKITKGMACELSDNLLKITSLIEILNSSFSNDIISTFKKNIKL